MRAADNAATKIQAGYRGYRVRKMLRQAGQDQNSHNLRFSRGLGEAQRPSAGKATVRETKKQAVTQDPVSTTLSAPPTAGADDATAAATHLDRCATTIQAGVRGFLVRRRRQAQNRAAATIQTNFRAFRARRQARLRAAAKI